MGKGRQSIISTGRVFKHSSLEAQGVLAPRVSGASQGLPGATKKESSRGVGAARGSWVPAHTSRERLTPSGGLVLPWRGPVSPMCPRHSNPWPAPGRRRVALEAPHPPAGSDPLHMASWPHFCINPTESAMWKHRVTQNYCFLWIWGRLKSWSLTW